MKIIIDRFENNIAICEKEDATLIEIEKEKLPIGVKEGTILNISNGKITIHTEATKNKRNLVESIFKNLFQ